MQVCEYIYVGCMCVVYILRINMSSCTL